MVRRRMWGWGSRQCVQGLSEYGGGGFWALNQHLLLYSFRPSLTGMGQPASANHSTTSWLLSAAADTHARESQAQPRSVAARGTTAERSADKHAVAYRTYALSVATLTATAASACTAQPQPP